MLWRAGTIDTKALLGHLPGDALQLAPHPGVGLLSSVRTVRNTPNEVGIIGTDVQLLLAPAPDTVSHALLVPEVGLAGQDQRHLGIGGLDPPDQDELVAGGSLSEDVPDGQLPARPPR